MQRDYVADGWLGAFIGARLFIEFTDKYPFDMKLKELKEHLVRSQHLTLSEMTNFRLLQTERVDRRQFQTQ